MPVGGPLVPRTASGPTVLAIDIGGTKMAVGLVDGVGSILWRDRSPTPRSSDPEVVWAALADLLAGVPTAPGPPPVRCGVGCGGPMTAGGTTVSPLNIPGWRDFPLLSRISGAVELPTRVDNDAKALALAEGWRGAARDRRNYVSMVVSTGVGGGVVVDGRLLDGRGGNAGHIGHVIVDPDGRRCPCGGRGCLEAEVSGQSIAAVTGEPAARASHAVRVRAGTLVGRAVASVANLLDLDLAAVAGSVALGFGPPFFAAAQAEVDLRCRLDFSAGCRVIPSPLGDDGPLIGAAALAWLGDPESPVGTGR